MYKGSILCTTDPYITVRAEAVHLIDGWAVLVQYRPEPIVLE